MFLFVYVVLYHIFSLPHGLAMYRFVSTYLFFLSLFSSLSHCRCVYYSSCAYIMIYWLMIWLVGYTHTKTRNCYIFKDLAILLVSIFMSVRLFWIDENWRNIYWTRFSLLNKYANIYTQWTTSESTKTVYAVYILHNANEFK